MTAVRQAAAPGGALPIAWRPVWPLAVAGAFTLYLVIFTALSLSGDYPVFTRDVFNQVAPAAVLLLGIQAVRQNTGQLRTGWLLLVLGVVGWAIGDAISTIYTFTFNDDIPFPGPSDPVYIAGYLLIIPAFRITCPGPWLPADRRALLDAATVLVACGVLIWQFLLVPLDEPAIAPLELTLSVSYPVLDFLLLTVLVIGFYGKERASARILLLIAAITISTLADGIYALTIEEGSYPAALNVLFVLVYCLFGVALSLSAPGAAMPSIATRSGAGIWLPRLLAFPIVLLVLSNGLLGFVEITPAMAFAAFAALTLLLIRQAITARENRHLLRALEDDRLFHEAMLRAQSDLGEAFIVIEGTRVVEINDAGLRFGGYDRDRVDELSLLDFVAPHDRPRACELLARIISHGEVLEGFEVDALTHDGRELTLECAAKQFTLNGVSRIVILARDVTTRRRTEKAMVEAQKLESMGILAGGVAHDFNNLLAVIQGNADMARATLPESSEAAEYLRDIGTATARAAGLARQMLTYAGRSEPATEPVDVSAVVEDMALLLRSSVSKQVHLRTDLAADLPTINGDRTQLQQVVMNLVINASEAIGDRPGDVSIITRMVDVTADELAESVHTPEAQPGTYIVIEVFDTGGGMDDLTRRRVFDPFFSTKFAGRGLGLASVLGIVRAHRGAALVDSVPGEGSCFRILLPVDEGTDR